MCLKYAIDCEMIGCDTGEFLARVSIVNEQGTPVLDEYIKPLSNVNDYRNISTEDKKQKLENGSDITSVKSKVAGIIKGCILIGHFLKFDLGALDLSHPQDKQRDLATYEPFLRINHYKPLALKSLASDYLGRSIQEDEYDSIEDAKACMDIYLKVASEWEKMYKF